MTCQEAEKLVVPYIKDELSPMELEEFIDHIKNCPNCREELEIHYMVDVGLKKLDQADGTYDIKASLKNAAGESYDYDIKGMAIELSDWSSMDDEDYGEDW